MNPIISNTFSLSAMKHGSDGNPGGNTATLFLYKRSSTPITAIDWNYALTYYFASKSLSSVPSGWSFNKIPSGTDPVYVTAATAYSTTNSDTINTNEWSTPVLYTENSNAATVFLFKRSANALTAHGITSDAVYYKFSDGKLYNGSGSSASVISNLNGWTRNIPDDNGNSCYVIQATALGTGTHDQILHGEWSTPTKLVTSLIVADLDNEMDSIACDVNGDVKSSQSVFTTIRMWKGQASEPFEVMTIKRNGTAITWDGNNNNVWPRYSSGVVTIEYDNGAHIDSRDEFEISIRSTNDASIDRKVNFTVNGVRPGPDGKPATIYNLMPSPSEVNVGKTASGSYTPQYNTLKCGYKKSVGSDITSVDEATGNIDSTYRIFFRRHLRSGDWGTLYYHYAHATYKRYLVITSGYSTSGLDVSTYDKVEFIIYKDTSSSSFNASDLDASKIVDRETVPVISDGQKGDTGNGISGASHYRKYTPTFSAPSAGDSGWISESSSSYPTIEGLSASSNPPKNFLWEKVVTSYTNGGSSTEIILVAQLDMGVCANLLQDTAFASDGQMEAWTVRNKYEPVSGQSTPAESGAGVISTSQTLDGQNSYYDKTNYGTSQLQYKEILQQIIYQTASDGIKKIAPSQWYTLSFYVKGYSAGYGNLATYVYPSCIDTSAAFYVDGVLQSSVPSDGAVNWKTKITTSWVRHSVTFRTKSSISAEQKLLFRLNPESSYTSLNQVWICMPKLERNSMATEWIENADDRMADDIQHIYVGEWVSGTTYYYGGGTGVRHVVRAKESASGAYTYFRMKKRTSSAGYTSSTQPYNDTSHWEKADYLKFVATDLLLAEEIIVDKLIPTRIKSKNNTFVVDENGNVTATSGTFANGTFNNATINSGSIGGFTIASGRIGASATATGGGGNMSLSSTFFRIGDSEGYAMLGDNVFPSTLGGAFTAVGRIINKRTNTATSYGFDVANYGLYIEVSGGTKNYGIQSNAVLRGSAVYGDKVKELDLSGSSYKIDISQYNVFIMKRSTTTDYTVNLPTEASIKSQFGYSSLPSDATNKVYFGVRFTLVCGIQSGAHNIWVSGVTNFNGDSSTIEMSTGDVLELLCTNYGGTFRYMMLGLHN